MHNHRRKSRDYLSGSITTELGDIIEASNIADDEAEIVRLRFARGWSIVKIADHMNMSERSVKKRIEKAYDKIYRAIKKDYL